MLKGSHDDHKRLCFSLPISGWNYEVITLNPLLLLKSNAVT